MLQKFVLDSTSNDEVSMSTTYCNFRLDEDFFNSKNTSRDYCLEFSGTTYDIPQNKESHFILIGIGEKNRKASNENRWLHPGRMRTWPCREIILCWPKWNIEGILTIIITNILLIIQLIIHRINYWLVHSDYYHKIMLFSTASYCTFSFFVLTLNKNALWW